jgi:hypothetical protein
LSLKSGKNIEEIFWITSENQKSAEQKKKQKMKAKIKTGIKPRNKS